MSKTQVILLSSFLLAFAAGTSLGLLVAQPSRSHRSHSMLTDELKLTPAQSDQMRKIWTDTTGAGTRGQGSSRRSAAAQERDQKVQAMLTDDQKAQFAAIEQEYTRKLDEMSRERNKAFDSAVEQSKRLMSPEQAQQYDELIKKQRERGGGQGMFGPRRRPASSSSQPATAEQPTSRSHT